MSEPGETTEATDHNAVINVIRTVSLQVDQLSQLSRIKDVEGAATGSPRLPPALLRPRVDAQAAREARTDRRPRLPRHDQGGGGRGEADRLRARALTALRRRDRGHGLLCVRRPRMMRLSRVIFPGGVHVAGQTRYALGGEDWDLSVHPEGIVARGKDGKTHWIPAMRAESGDLVEEAVAPVVSIAPKRAR